MDHHSFFAGLGGNRTHQTEAEPLPALRGHTWPLFRQGPRGRSCAPQAVARHDINFKRTVQYVRFPGGPPPEYCTRPWLLSFGDRTGSGVSNQV